jgi:hypothetical protein
VGEGCVYLVDTLRANASTQQTLYSRFLTPPRRLYQLILLLRIDSRHHRVEVGKRGERVVEVGKALLSTQPDDTT